MITAGIVLASLLGYSLISGLMYGVLVHRRGWKHWDLPDLVSALWPATLPIFLLVWCMGWSAQLLKPRNKKVRLPRATWLR